MEIDAAVIDAVAKNHQSHRLVDEIREESQEDDPAQIHRSIDPSGGEGRGGGVSQNEHDDRGRHSTGLPGRAPNTLGAARILSPGFLV